MKADNLSILVRVESRSVFDIDVSRLRPSATNPRKSIDEAQLAELAESIKAVGVQVPLSVRADSTQVEGEDFTYEIIGGERRWRAAKLAGLATVPAIARVMSDADVLESQLIDNLQRADLSPMEEATAYEFLIESARFGKVTISDEQLARKVGKPIGYVRSRRKLLDLLPEVREALSEKLITFGSALLIAKLLPADQERAAKAALGESQSETIADAIVRVKQQLAEDKAELAELDPEDYFDAWEPFPESCVKEWIADNILLDLSKAPWPLDADWLLVDVPACVDCPQRSGADQALFAELTAKSDVCTAPKCFEAKRIAFVQITTSKAKETGVPLLKLSSAISYMPAAAEAKTYKQGQWLRATDGECSSARQGITDEGEILWVCVDGKCKVHKHVADTPTAKSSASSADSWKAVQAKEEEKGKAYVAAEAPIRAAVIAEVGKKLRGVQLQRQILTQLLRGLRNNADANITFGKLIASSKLADFEPLAASILAAEYSIPSHYGYQNKNHRDELWKLAKLAGVDADAIANRLSNAAKPATKAVAKKAAGKPAKKKAPQAKAVKVVAKKKAGRK